MGRSLSVRSGRALGLEAHNAAIKSVKGRFHLVMKPVLHVVDGRHPFGYQLELMVEVFNEDARLLI